MRTYRHDAVQLAAFWIARPEQGALFDQGPKAETPAGECVTCGGAARGDQCRRCAALGAEALTLDTEPVVD